MKFRGFNYKIQSIVSGNQHCGHKTSIRFWGANHKRHQQPSPWQRWLTSIKVEMISLLKFSNKKNS